MLSTQRGRHSWMPTHLFLPSLLYSEYSLRTGHCARCWTSTVMPRQVHPWLPPRIASIAPHNGHLCFCPLWLWWAGLPVGVFSNCGESGMRKFSKVHHLLCPFFACPPKPSLSNGVNPQEQEASSWILLTYLVIQQTFIEGLLCAKAHDWKRHPVLRIILARNVCLGQKVWGPSNQI